MTHNTTTILSYTRYDTTNKKFKKTRLLKVLKSSINQYNSCLKFKKIINRRVTTRKFISISEQIYFLFI